MKEQSIKSKRNQRIEEKKIQIIKKVVELFYKEGYKQTSMRKICKVTGMTMGGLYNYIGSKENLLFMVYDYLMKNIYDTLNNPQQLEWNNKERLRLALKFYFVQTLKVRKESLLTLREMWLIKKPKREAMLNRHRGYISRLKTMLDKGVESGFLHIKDTQLTASFISYCFSMPVQRPWSLRQYTGREEEMIDDLVDIVMKVLI